MKFEAVRQRDANSGDEVIRFYGEVRAVDLVKLPLDRIDRALLERTDTPADILLALEMLFRRQSDLAKPPVTKQSG